MRFSGRAKPCPSSGYSTYVTGIPFFFIASTICSDSVNFTRGSFLPCPISSGFLIRSTYVSGEHSARNFFPSGVRRSPTRAANISIAGAQ